MEAVRIDRLAAGGDGVGRLADGRAVFVPRTAPGDLVELTDVRLHARFARAQVARVVDPGPGRVPPRCAHYDGDRCGGCQWQHLDTGTQLAARRTIVGDALRRIARLDQPDPPIEPSPSPWQYRTRITLHADGAGRIGFHPLEDPGRSFDLTRCEIATEPLNAAWRACREGRVRWPGDLEQIVLREDRDGGVHLVVRSGSAPDPSRIPGEQGRTLWWSPAPGRMTRIAGTGEGPAGAFEQVQPAMGERARRWAVDALGDVAGRHVWDLYAGIGEAGDVLAARGASVESVELDPTAVAHAGRTGAAGMTRHAGRVEEWIGRLEAPEAVLANPPRAGMGGQVVDGLLRAAPRVVSYISCDPATLARDLQRLAARYRVAAVQAFDLFPQTAHVETAVRLERL